MSILKATSVAFVVVAIGAGVASSRRRVDTTVLLATDNALAASMDSRAGEYVATPGLVDCPDEIEVRKFLDAGSATEGLSGVQMGERLHIACGRGELLPSGAVFDVVADHDQYAKVLVHSPGFSERNGYERWVPKASILGALKRR